MTYAISRHAYKRARQRMGLNRKAFKRIVEQNKLSEDFKLIIKNDVIVTVENIIGSCDRNLKHKISKSKRREALINQERDS